MGIIDRTYRLTNEPGGLGLSCTAAGVSLAGVALLRKTGAGFAPRPMGEISALVAAIYEADINPDSLWTSLDLIAEALGRGEIARAMIVAVLTRLPELSFAAAARLANVEERLAKYNSAEPRDWHGRWTTGGDGEGPIGTPESFIASEDDPGDDEPPVTDRVYQALEDKYDDLGPIEFAKQVIQFGDRLGRDGEGFTQAEREAALTEYNFLQDRLTFWLGYDYKPAIAQANLISAALTLYEGGVNGGLIPVGGRHDLPQSMVVVAAGAMGLDSGHPEAALRRPSIGSAVEEEPVAPSKAPEEFGKPALPAELPEMLGELGGVVHNDDIGISWTGGIEGQGLPWGRYFGQKYPNARELAQSSKTFDHFVDKSGEAISEKTLNTLSITYIKNPQRIYGRLKGYVNAAADYDKPRTRFDLDPEEIKSKTIQLAIPEYTSRPQWERLDRVVRYGKDRGVLVVITRIRE